MYKRQTMRLRKTNPGDLPQLKALWALGFGDTEQEIEAFFAISYPCLLYTSRCV